MRKLIGIGLLILLAILGAGLAWNVRQRKKRRRARLLVNVEEKGDDR